jgi:hypothetical protein
MTSFEEDAIGCFYKRWSSTIYTYCRLVLGSDWLAQSATEHAFVEFLRDTTELDQEKLPRRLLRNAFRTCQNRCALVTRGRGGNRLEDALLLLSCEERSVFVMRSVLDLTTDEVSAATGLSRIEVGELWVQALLRVRKLMFAPQPTPQLREVRV